MFSISTIETSTIFFFTRLILTLTVKTLVHRKILAEYSGYYFKLTCLRYDLAIFYFNV